jgi:hypothetical protein
MLAARALLASAPERAVLVEAPLPDGNALVRSMVGRQRTREETLKRYTYDVLVSDEGEGSSSGASAAIRSRASRTSSASRPRPRSVTTATCLVDPGPTIL